MVAKPKDKELFSAIRLETLMIKAGTYLKEDAGHDDKICSVILIKVENDIKEWQKKLQKSLNIN